MFGHEAICCSRQVIEVVKQKVSLEHPIAKLLKVKILAAVFPKSDEGAEQRREQVVPVVLTENIHLLSHSPCWHPVINRPLRPQPRQRELLPR